MKFRQLLLSRAKNGNLNCKVGNRTFFVIAFHAGEGYYVHPKLPGFKSVKVGCYEEGATVALKLYKQFTQELIDDRALR